MIFLKPNCIYLATLILLVDLLSCKKEPETNRYFIKAKINGIHIDIKNDAGYLSDFGDGPRKLSFGGSMRDSTGKIISLRIDLASIGKSFESGQDYGMVNFLLPDSVIIRNEGIVYQPNQNNSKPHK